MNRVVAITFVASLYLSSPAFTGPLSRPRLAVEIAIENRFVHVHIFGLGGEGLMKDLRSRGFAEYRDITEMVMQRISAGRERGKDETADSREEFAPTLIEPDRR